MQSDPFLSLSLMARLAVIGATLFALYIVVLFCASLTRMM